MFQNELSTCLPDHAADNRATSISCDRMDPYWEPAASAQAFHQQYPIHDVTA